MGANMKMLSESTVLRELQRLRAQVRSLPDGKARDMAYGSMQALAWVSRDHAARPAKVVADYHAIDTKPAKG
jgi:hypothetical protein